MMAHPLLYVASMLLVDPTVAFVSPTAYSAISKPRPKVAHDVPATARTSCLRLIIDPSSAPDISASVDSVLGGTPTKLLVSIGLAAFAVAGAFLSDQSTDNDSDASTAQSLDAKYTDPDQLQAEYRAREEALQLAMEREAELALAEERGEYNKTRADAELVSWKLAEGGSDPAGIQSSLPEEEERAVREMIAEQRRLEEEGANDDDGVSAGEMTSTAKSNDGERSESATADIDVASADPLTLVQMMEKAKAQDEAVGKLDVAARIADKDSEIEQQARNILAVEFAEMEEEQDRAKQKQEEKRIADLQEGQRLLDLMSQTRQAEVDQLQSLVQLQKNEDDERTNEELNEAMELASDKPAASTTEVQEATVAQILEAERAKQVEKRKIALDEFSAEMDRQKAAEAERVRQAEAQRAADIAKAQIERDMAMVRKYDEERKAKAAEAVAAADKERLTMTSTTVEETKMNEQQAAASQLEEPENDIPENTLLSLKTLSKDGKVERKRDKLVKLVKNKKVVGAGLAYLVGKKLVQIFLL